MPFVDLKVGKSGKESHPYFNDKLDLGRTFTKTFLTIEKPKVLNTFLRKPL